MPEPITLQFRYTEQDYVRAMHLFQSERVRIRRDLPIALGLAGLCAFLLPGSESGWLWATGLALALAFAGFLLYAHLVVPLLVFRRVPKLHEEYLLHFAPEGIEFHSAGVRSRVAWSFYDGLRSDAHTHLLCYGTGGFTALPRRVFESPAQEEAFLALARSSLRRG